MTEVLCFLVMLYTIVIVVRMILSWFPASDGLMAQLSAVTYRLTEPVLGPARRVIPPIGAVDLSPLVVLLLLQIVVRGVILRCPVG